MYKVIINQAKVHIKPGYHHLVLFEDPCHQKEKQGWDEAGDGQGGQGDDPK